MALTAMMVGGAADAPPQVSRSKDQAYAAVAEFVAGPPAGEDPDAGDAAPAEGRKRSARLKVFSLVSAVAAVAAAFSALHLALVGQACPPPADDSSLVGLNEVDGLTPRGVDALEDYSVDEALPITFWNTGSCPFAQRAWITLEEKDVPYHFVRVNLQRKPDDLVVAYRRASSDGHASAKVPVVQTADGHSFIESDIVAEYLSDRFPERGTELMPRSPELRARVRLFKTTFDATFIPGMYAVLQASDDDLEIEADRFGEKLKTLNDFLIGQTVGDGPYLCEDFTLAEVHAASFVQRAMVLLPHFKNVHLLTMCRNLRLKRLKAWIEAVVRRKSVAQTGVPQADLIAMYSKMYSKVPR